MNKRGPIPGLVHPHHGEVGEGVQHWHALAKFSASIRRKEGGGGGSIGEYFLILNAGDELRIF